jgi:hypothetical protein
MKVRVALGEATFGLTLTERQLQQKSWAEAVVVPTLEAFNKKNASPRALGPDDIESLIVEGTRKRQEVVDWSSETVGSLLQGDEDGVRVNIIVTRREGASSAQRALGGVNAMAATPPPPPPQPPPPPADLAARDVVAALHREAARALELERGARAACQAATAALRAVAPDAAVSRLRTVDGRLLVVIDAACESADVEAARLGLEGLAAFRHADGRGGGGAERSHLTTEHDLDAFVQTPLHRRMARLVALFFGDGAAAEDARAFAPTRVHASALMYGDAPVRSAAGEAPPGQTVGAAFFVGAAQNGAAWDASLGGEHTFLRRPSAGSSEEDGRGARPAVGGEGAGGGSSGSGRAVGGEPVDVVLPRPGRLILFDEALERVAAPPSRLFWGHLLTLHGSFRRNDGVLI